VPLEESPPGGNRVDVFAKVPGTAGNVITCQSNNSARIYAMTQGLSPSTSAQALAQGAAVSALYTNAKTRLAAAGGFGNVDLFVVTLGTNDGKRQVDTGNAPNFATQLASFVAQLLADNPTAKIVLANPLVSSTGAINTYLTTVVAPAIAAIVAGNPTAITSADAYALGAGSGGTLVLSADGVHATRFGNDGIAAITALAAASILGL
jgi:lysophospholipase L1-like esterase